MFRVTQVSIGYSVTWHYCQLTNQGYQGAKRETNIILIIFSIFFISTTTIASTATDSRWRSWSSNQFTQAKNENKFVILDLEAVWCHWCHVMRKKTYSNKNVGRLLDKHFISVRVDQDSRPDLANKYRDYGWPATIIFNSDGEEIVKRRKRESTTDFSL